MCPDPCWVSDDFVAAPQDQRRGNRVANSSTVTRSRPCVGPGVTRFETASVPIAAIDEQAHPRQVERSRHASSERTGRREAIGRDHDHDWDLRRRRRKAGAPRQARVVTRSSGPQVVARSPRRSRGSMPPRGWMALNATGVWCRCGHTGSGRESSCDRHTPRRAMRRRTTAPMRTCGQVRRDGSLVASGIGDMMGSCPMVQVVVRARAGWRATGDARCQDDVRPRASPSPTAPRLAPGQTRSWRCRPPPVRGQSLPRPRDRISPARSGRHRARGVRSVRPYEARIRACYTPRPVAPTGIGGGVREDLDRPCRLVRREARPRVSSPSSCRSSSRRIAIAPEWKDQQRLWGHSFHPMCSYLASFPAALTHAFIARYSRPGDVVLDPFSGRGTTPLQACAEGRIGVGNDLNPFAHLLTAAKVEPATRAAGARPGSPQLRLAWNADVGRLARPRRRAVAADPAAPTRCVPAAGSGRRPGDGVGDRPGRGRARVPSADARPAAVRPDVAPARRPDRPVPGRRDHRDPPRQERELPLRADAEHVQHGAALRPRLRRPDGVRIAGARRLRRPLEAKLDRLYRQPAAAGRPGSRSSATPATSRHARRAALRARGRPDRARLVVTSPPYLRVVKYGYYNWLRTWFLGFDAARDRRDARRRPPSRAVPRVPARRPRRPPPGADRRRGRRARHRRRARPTAGGRIRGRRRPRRAASGSRPPSPRAIGWPASRSTTSPPIRKMTKLWGDEAGARPRPTGSSSSAPREAGRRRALAGAGRRRRLERGRRGRCASI